MKWKGNDVLLVFEGLGIGGRMAEEHWLQAAHS